MSVRIAAIDQGTTSTRALLVDSDGAMRIVASLRHANTFPQPGWVEQDAVELLAHIGRVLAAAGPVDAIGLANQGESCLAWDARSGEPLSPVIVWQDTRTTARLADMARAGLASTVAERAALPLDPYFSASKLAWILENNPRAKAAHAAGRLRLGTTDAFFLDRLTGTFATDRATASRTSLMNIETGEWDADLCRLFGVPIDCLPDILPNTGNFGTVDGTPVAAAIVDQQAALYGHGCRAPGDGKITFGTGAFALAVTGGTAPRAASKLGLLPTVAWDLGEGIVYAVDGGIQDAGSALEWAMRAGLADDITDFAAFSAASAISRGLVFIPGFSGLGCPYWDRTASPLMLGLRPDMTRVDMRQALLEGIAFLTGTVLSAIQTTCSLSHTIPVDGGLSKSPYFLQCLADVGGLTIVADAFAERTAFGVAALTAHALGSAMPAPSSGKTVYRPNGTFPDRWRQKFDHAIRCCRGWGD